MIKVGITGGIGSGKTTACRIFEWLGVPVYYADERAKWLMQHDPELVSNILALFGTDAYTTDGSLNRAHLSRIIFADPDKRKQLNALVHPAVWRDGEKWQQQHRSAPYTLKEAALLYESGGDRLLDRMIVVTAPEALRIARVVQRDGLSPEEVKQRIRAQMPEAEKAARADFIIENDGEHSLLQQVLSVHHTLLAPVAGAGAAR